MADQRRSAFGAWLQSELDSRGLGPEELARLTHVPDPVVVRWLAGASAPSATQRARIAAALGIPPAVVEWRAGGPTSRGRSGTPR